MNDNRLPSLWVMKDADKNSYIHKFKPIAHQVLYNRGFNDYAEILSFMEPSLEHLIDPFLLPDMQDAVDIVRQAIQQQQRVVIYGDYDVDGITATAVLIYVLQDLGLHVESYIPDRISEGYGLNIEAITELSKKFDLMITVDCGITSVNEIQYAVQNEMQVIVIDHHLPAAVLPPANAIINHQRLDSSYPERVLAGVGVVFKFCEALLTSYFGQQQGRKKMLSWIDLVMIGTVADIVPLNGENRIIVAQGLAKINSKVTLKGLAALINICQLSKKNITCGHISFGIAPRLNAGGRIGSAQDSLSLLLTKDDNEAAELAMLLDSQNEKRKAIEKRIEMQALELIEKSSIENSHFIMLSDNAWHHGVLGIVASRLVERFYRPVILLGQENGIYKGSGRSIPGVHLQQLLSEHSDLMISFGGHAMAVGLTINSTDISLLHQNLNEFIKRNYTTEDLIPKIYIDNTVKLTQLSHENIQQMNKLSPYGMGNPRPNLAIKGAQVTKISSLSNGKHTKLFLKQYDSERECVFWQTSNIDINEGAIIDIVGSIEESTWNNQTQVTIIGKDWKRDGFSRINDCRNIPNKNAYIKSVLENGDDGLIVFYGYDYGEWRDIAEQVLRPLGDPIMLYSKDSKSFIVNSTSNIKCKHVFVYDTPMHRQQLMELNICEDISMHLLYNKNNYQQQLKLWNSMRLFRPMLTEFYRFLKQLDKSAQRNDFVLSQYKTAGLSNIRSSGQIVTTLTMLQIFQELGFLEWGLKENNIINFSFNELLEKKDLGNSNTLKVYNHILQKAVDEMMWLWEPLDILRNYYLRRTN